MEDLPARVLLIGGDGFAGWPLAMHLSRRGSRVLIVDNLSRRDIDSEHNIHPLVKLPSIQERIETWHDTMGVDHCILFEKIDVSCETEKLKGVIRDFRPQAVVHLGEQRSAPYSMMNSTARRYTVTNNVCGTHNVLDAIVEIDPTIHMVHIGTMGVYGYGDADGITIQEGYVNVEMTMDDGTTITKNILHPPNPGSLYHQTKVVDQSMFAYYCKAYGLRVTDLHQGIIYGYQTEETELNPLLATRIDYDHLYGTVLNRFVVQAACGHPITVYGTGGQTRAFISLQDSVRCVAIALKSPPPPNEGRARIINQMSEVRRVRDLAEMMKNMFGAEVDFIDNPRDELSENNLSVVNKTLIEHGYKPELLDSDYLMKLFKLVQDQKSCVNEDSIRPTVKWGSR